MEENQNEVKQENELKQEAQETIKQAKEQMKDINFKEEAEKGKGLIAKLVKNPIGTIREIVQDNENKFFKTALLIVCLWVVIVVARDILRCITLSYHKFNILNIVKLGLAPICKVLVMAVIIHVMNKENKQSLSKSITAVAISKIPLVISACLSFLTIISSRMSDIVNPIGSVLSAISTILMFFVAKEMFNEQDNEKALKSYVKVRVVYCVLDFAFSFLGIYL